jgi:hypothetical protein
MVADRVPAILGRRVGDDVLGAGRRLRAGAASQPYVERPCPGWILIDQHQSEPPIRAPHRVGGDERAAVGVGRCCGGGHHGVGRVTGLHPILGQHPRTPVRRDRLDDAVRVSGEEQDQIPPAVTPEFVDQDVRLVAVEVRGRAAVGQEPPDDVGVEERAGHLDHVPGGKRGVAVLGDQFRQRRGESLGALLVKHARQQSRLPRHLRGRRRASVVERIPLEREE